MGPLLVVDAVDSKFNQDEPERVRGRIPMIVQVSETGDGVGMILMPDPFISMIHTSHSHTRRRPDTEDESSQGATIVREANRFDTFQCNFVPIWASQRSSIHHAEASPRVRPERPSTVKLCVRWRAIAGIITRAK